MQCSLYDDKSTFLGPHVECAKHGKCRMTCTSPCNTKKIAECCAENHSNQNNIMEKQFVEECRKLLNSISDCELDKARLAHRLSRACDRLEAIFQHSDIVFKGGYNRVTFDKDFIQFIQSEEN